MLIAKPEKIKHKVFFEGLFKYETRTKWVHSKVVLVNMLENLDIDDPDFVQIIVCQGCGMTDCAFGNYVKIRRNGSLILWLPVDQTKLEEDWEIKQFTTANLLKKHGIVLFEWVDFKHISNIFNNYDTLDTLPKHISELLPPLIGNDLQGLWAYELPTQFKKDNYINGMSEAVNSIMTSESLEVNQAKNIISEIWLSLPEWNNPVIELLPKNNLQIETVFLDTKKTIEWQAIVRIDDKWWSYLGQSYVLKNDPE